MIDSNIGSKLIRGAAALAAASAFAAFMAVAPATAQEPAGALEPVRVDSVEVRGHERLAEQTVLSWAGIRLGDHITYRDIQESIRRLWSTRHFSDVQVQARDIDPADPQTGVRLLIEVREQPFVTGVEFRGLENVRARTVRDSAGIRVGEPYDPARAAEAQALVRELLADRGIRLRSVSHRLEPVVGSDTDHRLIFDVVEGERVAISEVVFRGNEAFSSRDLERAMSTRAEGFFWFRQGMFDEAAFQTDLRQNLPELYARHGYIDFAVVRDSVYVDPVTGKGRIEVEVHEGEQYRLVDFDIRGNRQFPTDDLRRYYEATRAGLLGAFGIGGGLGSEEGQIAARTPVFNQGRFEQATQDVQQAYRNQGFLYAQVMPFVERTQTDSGEPAVRVGWEIQERDPAYVNRVDIAGNTYTHENVIRDRIFVLPGDVYSEELLIQSYRSIMGLGFFESPLPMPRMEQLDNGDIDIIFEVREKQTGSINFGTTIGGWGGVAGFLGYDQPNLFGQAKSGSLRWEFGRRYNNFTTAYTDPAIRGSQVSGSASIFSSKENPFFNFPEGERRRTGSSLRFGLPLPMDRRFSRIFLGYQISRTEYTDFGDTGDIFGLPPGLLSTASLTLMRNTLDSPLFPTVGTRQEIRGEFSGGLLGGDGDFQKYTARGSWWTPVAEFGSGQPGVRPVRTALGLSAEAGAIVGDAGRFPFERFWMGGVQFGQSLRGYDETTVTPLGYMPKGIGTLSERLGDAYLRLSAEYAVRFSDAISVSLFGDAGNIWREAAEANPTRLFRSAGIGVQLVTPFGPMGLDFGYGFDKPEPGWQLHFMFGHGM
jgi:outer membrane protein insertion porin family